MHQHGLSEEFLLRASSFKYAPGRFVAGFNGRTMMRDNAVSAYQKYLDLLSEVNEREGGLGTESFVFGENLEIDEDKKKKLVKEIKELGRTSRESYAISWFYFSRDDAKHEDYIMMMEDPVERNIRRQLVKQDPTRFLLTFTVADSWKIRPAIEEWERENAIAINAKTVEEHYEDIQGLIEELDL